jgi:hypothetical protein
MERRMNTSRSSRLALTVALTLTFAGVLRAQIAVTTRATNLRRTASSDHRAIRELPQHDTVDVLSLRMRNGYVHVRTRDDSTAGWLWSRNVRVDTTAASVVTAVRPTSPVRAPLEVQGSSSFVGCGDHLWRHVYNPNRLIIHHACVTVTGVIVDATATRKHPSADGVRHEGDGDTHGWLKLDPEFENMLNAGNLSDEDGNLVFEIVCHYTVKQADAKPACKGFNDQTVIPPVGTRVELTGTFVQDDKHAHWNEIHPVSRIVPKP